LIQKQAVVLQEFTFPPRCILVRAYDAFSSKVERDKRSSGAKMRVETEIGSLLDFKVLSFGSKFSKS
jgi:hypothetical protein